MATAMGPQKYKIEQISVGHFCGKRATEMVPEKSGRSVFFLWSPKEMRSFL